MSDSSPLLRTLVIDDEEPARGILRDLLRESLASLEEKLDSEQFARVHRSAIVNMDRVKEMRPLFKGSYALILEDGTQLKLSRQRRAELEERLSQSS